MTRLDAASFAAGSLMFPVEIPGIEDMDLTSTSSKTRSRARGRRSIDEEDVCSVNFSASGQDSPAIAKIVADVQTLKRKGAAADATTLARALRELGYAAERVAQHASHTGPSAMRLAHDFVIVKSCGPVPLVIEPFFQEHFRIGSVYATERYRQLLAAVPEELVAPYSVLAEMVQLICREMKWSFEATGNSLPPWRSGNTVLSRWSPAKAM